MCCPAKLSYSGLDTEKSDSNESLHSHPWDPGINGVKIKLAIPAQGKEREVYTYKPSNEEKSNDCRYLK